MIHLTCIPEGRQCTCHLKGDTPRICSHVAMQETKPGQPMFKNRSALEQACEMLGLSVYEKQTYTWFNRHVGDYPVPKGINVNDIGGNADFVVGLNPERTAEAQKKYGGTPYEIGMVPDPNNPGCWVPMYDFWSGGYGLEEVVGRALFKDKNERHVQQLCPKLKQAYDAVCTKMAAAQAGDQCHMMTMQQLRENFDAWAQKYPQLRQVPLPPAAKDDDERWVSITDTEQRLGVR